MSFTQNYNRNVFGPIHWKLMGPIADRPATAEENTTYVSTDEGDGLLRAYIYTGGSWMKMQGIDGFTGGGGGSLPADPGADGTYVLENTVSDGSGTLSWGSGGGGDILVVHFGYDEGTGNTTCDKTYVEVCEAAVSQPIVGYDGEMIYPTVAFFAAGGGTPACVAFSAIFPGTKAMTDAGMLTIYLNADDSIDFGEAHFAMTPSE